MGHVTSVAKRKSLTVITRENKTSDRRHQQEFCDILGRSDGSNGVSRRHQEIVGTNFSCMYLFQHLQTTHFSPAFSAMGDTTLGDSSSIILLILSPVGAAGTASVADDKALTLTHLELLVLKAFAMPAYIAINATIEKKLRTLNIIRK